MDRYAGFMTLVLGPGIEVKAPAIDGIEIADWCWVSWDYTHNEIKNVIPHHEYLLLGEPESEEPFAYADEFGGCDEPPCFIDEMATFL